MSHSHIDPHADHFDRNETAINREASTDMTLDSNTEDLNSTIHKKCVEPNDNNGNPAPRMNSESEHSTIEYSNESTINATFINATLDNNMNSNRNAYLNDENTVNTNNNENAVNTIKNKDCTNTCTNENAVNDVNRCNLVNVQPNNTSSTDFMIYGQNNQEDAELDEVALDIPMLNENTNIEPKRFPLSGLLKRDPKSTKKKKVRRFYKEQNAFVDEVFQLYEDSHDNDSKNEEKARKFSILRFMLNCFNYDSFCMSVSFLSNFLIFCLKLIASIASGSLALIASTIDSSLDLASGLILFIANKLRYRSTSRDYMHYPLGKSRLEPVAYIIFACVVCTATLQVTIDSIQTVLFGAINQVQGNNEEVPYVDNTTWIFWFSTGTLIIVAVWKLILHIICRPSKSPSVQAYAQDHKNDVIFNSVLAVAVGCGSLSPYIWWFDPVAALFVSLYILQGWIRNVIEYVKKLIGFSADSKTISKLTHLTYAHDDRILYIDTVRASYVGLGLWVEVDIVLPEDMPLKEAHDIGESLQKKIEAQEDVERAWVHLDHEFEHSPHAEHKKPE